MKTVSEEIRDLAIQLQARLLKEKQTLATAESCTGGAIAQAITSIPGSSSVFPGGIVAYSNRIKIDVLGVSEDLIQKHTEVSREVVLGMHRNACRLFGSDYGIATTGLLSPSPDNGTVKAGTVWIAVGTPGKPEVVCIEVNSERVQAVQEVVTRSLEMINGILKRIL